MKAKYGELLELLGISVPIIQGAMYGISGTRLVAAVSEAGGLGVLAAGDKDAETIREEIQEVRKKTNKPFGINLMMKSSKLDEQISILKEESIPIVFTGAGNPERYIRELKENDMKVIPVVASVALAKRLERYGADAVVAEGMESGGHIGTMSTFCLVPQVVQAISLPVIAAGGICDGKGVVASFALGAVGVQVGTRFEATVESDASDDAKNAIIQARDVATIVLNQEDLQKDSIRVLKKEKSVMAGQVASCICSLLTAKEAIDSMWKEALDILND